MGSLRLGMSATLLPNLKATSRPEHVAGPCEVQDAPAAASTPGASLLSLTAPSPPPRPTQDMNRLGGASRRARVEGGQLGGDEWTRHGSFVNKPTRGWLHSDNVVSSSGVSYTVRVRLLKTFTQSLSNLSFGFFLGFSGGRNFIILPSCFTMTCGF